MSSFSGKLLEESLDYIRIDQFEQENHDGFKFFLSHFHTDHYKGLFQEDFIKQLKENYDKMLYCSELTKQLILRKSGCKIPEDKVFTLAPHEPYLISFRDRDPIEVRAIPAGHCPGSVMFLIEQNCTRVLYTGDFRIHPDELRKFNTFHNKDESVKKINTLYLDATFSDPKWLTFPSRAESLEEIVKVVKPWLEEKPEHQVGIWYISYHGLEWALMRLAEALKLHKGVWVVDGESYINYACIPELKGAISREKGATRIHLCPVREGAHCGICRSNRAIMKTIKPCAWSFNQNQLKQSRSIEESKCIKIAYATHSSLEELIGTVKYLSPDRIHLCALPNISHEQAMANLRLDVNKLKRELENKENHKGNSPKKPHLQLSTINNVYTCSHQSEDLTISSSEEEIDQRKPLSQSDLYDLDSPPL